MYDVISFVVPALRETPVFDASCILSSASVIGRCAEREDILRGLSPSFCRNDHIHCKKRAVLVGEQFTKEQTKTQPMLQ